MNKPGMADPPRTELAAAPGPLFSARKRIIGESPALRSALRQVEQFGPTDIPLVLEGESGTGKELFAQAIHEVSPQARGRLVTLDCGTIPEELAESELFGYHAGAFTGAVKDRLGRVAWADGGTLFIDELTVLSLSAQAKLLRLIEQQTFVPLGAPDCRPRSVQTRFVSATNVALRAAVTRGVFRRDLYHRLNGFTIELPPLRERGRDVELLAEHFLGKFRDQFGKPELEIAPAALELLRLYPWPGNVRELQRVLAAAAVIADRAIAPEHLPAAVAGASHAAESLLRLSAHLQPALASEIDLKHVKERAGRAAERELIVALQQRTHLNQRELARLLGVDPKTLRSRLKEMPQESHGGEA
jgi:transcriptional regulator with GAF, ATPase, and Fis domain